MKAKLHKKHITPSIAIRAQLAKLSHDNVCVGDFSIMTGTTVVWLSEQAKGENLRQKIEIPRDVFNKLIKWWTLGIVPREDRRSR